MLKSTLALLILALAALDVSAAQGAGQGEAADADRLNAQVLKLYREGKYEEALPVAKRVVELREKALGGEDLRVAFALANLGNIYARKGEQKEAEPLFKRALTMAEKLGAAETEFAADLHTQLGLMRVNGGKYREAEPLLRRVLEIKEKAEPVCGHPLLAKEAVAAALKARFTPMLLSGLPVKVSGVITYNFVLQ